MSPSHDELRAQIVRCDLGHLSPEALSSLMVILQCEPRLELSDDCCSSILQTIEERYDSLPSLTDKLRCLEAWYRMAGVHIPQIQTDGYMEEECDERFDELLSSYLDLTSIPREVYKLLCYRLHSNLVCPSSVSTQWRTVFMVRCFECYHALIDAELSAWMTLPFTDRLECLWQLCVSDFPSQFFQEVGTPSALRLWESIEACFQILRREFVGLEHPDVSTLVSYYRTLCALYPDVNGKGAEAHDEYMRRFIPIYESLPVDDDNWWVLSEIAIRHQHSLSSRFRFDILAELPFLRESGLNAFRETFYRWTFSGDDTLDLQAEREMRMYATACAERLMSHSSTFDRPNISGTDLDTATETSYLLTLLLSVSLSGATSQLNRLSTYISSRLPILPNSRLKTHLQTHLYTYGMDDFLLPAYNSAISWPVGTLSFEDLCIQRYLCDEYEYTHRCAS